MSGSLPAAATRFPYFAYESKAPSMTNSGPSSAIESRMADWLSRIPPSLLPPSTSPLLRRLTCLLPLSFTKSPSTSKITNAVSTLKGRHSRKLNAMVKLPPTPS
ncbi:hypothetical protein ACHAW6_000560 [Cyclotella cf. meneghiniana]